MTETLSISFVCTKCNKPKNINEFYKKTSLKKGVCSVCKDCSIIKDKQRYKKRKDKIILNNYNKREILYEKISLLKNKPCIDCNQTFPHYCLEFDHLYDKKISISKMIHECFSYENVIKEIQKTELVCILCHRDRTFKRLKNKARKPTIQRNIDFINKIKNNPCEICNKIFSPHQMDFDHLRDKLNNVSTLVHTGFSISIIAEEMKKCRLLCAICHRIETYKNY
jgi:hypothetical protein